MDVFESACRQNSINFKLIHISHKRFRHQFQQTGLAQLHILLNWPHDLNLNANQQNQRIAVFLVKHFHFIYLEFKFPRRSRLNYYCYYYYDTSFKL